MGGQDLRRPERKSGGGGGGDSKMDELLASMPDPSGILAALQQGVGDANQLKKDVRKLKKKEAERKQKPPRNGCWC